MDRPTPLRAAPPAIAYRSWSPARIGAMVRRYLYLLRSSWPRVLDIIYWPLVQMLMWGFLQLYLTEDTGTVLKIGGAFIGAMLLWDILFRGQISFSISFLEEMWARNIGNLMISPLRPLEFMAALMIMSIIRLAVGFIPVSIMAKMFFGFSVWSMGFAFGAFFANLIITSWAIGITVSGLVLRKGLGAESLAWSVTFVLLPLACVYYPVAVLPGWLQIVAWALPPTYVFEGMRAILFDGVFRLDLMAAALALNGIYLMAALFAFFKLYDAARRHGSLLQSGE